MLDDAMSADWKEIVTAMGEEWLARQNMLMDRSQILFPNGQEPDSDTPPSALGRGSRPGIYVDEYRGQPIAYEAQQDLRVRVDEWLK
jgi:hypothetical protein